MVVVEDQYQRKAHAEHEARPEGFVVAGGLQQHIQQAANLEAQQHEQPHAEIKQNGGLFFSHQKQGKKSRYAHCGQHAGEGPGRRIT